MSKAERAVAIAFNLAYVLVVVAFLWAMFPGLRRRLQAVAKAAIWNYQLGLYLASRQPTPGYVRAILEGGQTVEEPQPKRGSEQE